MQIIINKQTIKKKYLLDKTICFCLVTIGPVVTISALGITALVFTSYVPIQNSVYNLFIKIFFIQKLSSILLSDKIQ